MADIYEVGYAKPPKSTQFKKGQSGNAKGRPKGSQNFATMFHKIGDEKIKVQDNGRTRKVTKKQAIAHQITNNALKGQQRALNDYVKVSRAFPEPEQERQAVAELPERHGLVIANIVRRIRESESAATETETIQTVTTKKGAKK